MSSDLRGHLCEDSTMKRVCLLLVVIAVVSVGTSQLGDHDSYEAYDSSEETVNFEGASVDYMTCIEEGTCIPVDFPEKTASSYMNEAPEHSFPEDDEYLQDAPSGHVPQSHYSKLCNKLGQKMQELESLHPELKNLKLKLLQMLDAPGSSFNLQCKEGESIITKVLDLVIYLAEKLKADFAKASYTEIPVEVSTSIPSEEIIAEEHDIPVQVGSIRGIPGVHYPNYSEIPITSFSCSDKKYIPGFYADLETGCQVFHVCYEHRRESFLCPVGTVFNQPILACDYWYSSSCSQAPLYYDVNAEETNIEVSKDVSNIGNLITTIIEGGKSKHVKKPDIAIPKGDLSDLLKFLPIKAKIVEFVKSKFIHSKPVVVVPKPIVLPIAKPLPLFKPKLAAKVAIKVPLAKAKFAAAAAAVPIVKTKLFSAAAIPVVKAKVALPLMKTKYAAASVPVFKAKTAAKVIPFVKLTAGKKVVSGVPIIKAKFAKSAMISPLTKKALALGYMKLLKAKKLALMG